MLLEFVIPPGDAPHMAKMIDLTMLGMLTGRERRATEWHALLGRGGWRINEVIDTQTPLSVIEAVVA